VVIEILAELLTSDQAAYGIKYFADPIDMEKITKKRLTGLLNGPRPFY